MGWSEEWSSSILPGAQDITRQAYRRFLGWSWEYAALWVWVFWRSKRKSRRRCNCSEILGRFERHDSEWWWTCSGHRTIAKRRGPYYDKSDPGQRQSRLLLPLPPLGRRHDVNNECRLAWLQCCRSGCHVLYPGWSWVYDSPYPASGQWEMIGYQQQNTLR